jgi:hypothetical protein
MTTRTALALGSTLAAGLLAPATASASPAYCGAAGSGQAGLGVTHVRAYDVSCKAARWVARKTRAEGDGITVTRVLGVAWSCRITQQATGSEPGAVLATKVTCQSPGGALVLYHLRS